MADTPPRVPRFFVEERLRAGASCALGEDAAHHALHVLRLRAGDEIALFDGRGGEYSARVASIERRRVLLDVLAHRAIERESPLRAVLLQGVSSGERMDFTVRKAVELGVAEIHPLLAAASVARPKAERALARQEHWRRIAIAACEQCGRNRVPVVHPLAEAKAFRVDSSGGVDGSGARILLSPLAELPFSRIVAKGVSELVLAVGPEAGFNAEEERAFLEQGFVPARLGARVLRTETAALAALAALNALLGDF